MSLGCVCASSYTYVVINLPLKGIRVNWFTSMYELSSCAVHVGGFRIRARPQVPKYPGRSVRGGSPLADLNMTWLEFLIPAGLSHRFLDLSSTDEQPAQSRIPHVVQPSSVSSKQLADLHQMEVCVG